MVAAAQTRIGRYGILALLTAIYASSALDRMVLGILAEPVKADLKLSDTELGMLSGLVFAVFYTFFGVPVGWLADRFGRVRVIAISCAIWSACSSLGGLAMNYWQLALARIGVGIGEAGGTAPSYSLISSFFSTEERGKALGIYSLGAPIATLVGGAACGWIAAEYGWRIALATVSLPGVIFALLLYMWVREPTKDGGNATVHPGSLIVAIGDYFRSPALALSAFAAGATSFITQALIIWLPPYLMRIKGMSMTDIALYYSVAFAFAFGLGLWFGGFMVDRLLKRTRRAYALVPCICNLIAAPFYVIAVFTPQWSIALPLLLIPVALNATFLAPMLAMVQEVSTPARRSVYSALFLMINNLTGAGLGPLFVGMVSDFAMRQGSEQPLQIAMLALAPMFVVAAIMHFAVSRVLGRILPVSPLPAASSAG